MDAWLALENLLAGWSEEGCCMAPSFRSTSGEGAGCYYFPAE